MSGNTENVRIWEGADLYIWPDADTPPVVPDDSDPFAALDAGWKATGLLAQDNGISFTNAITETKHYAYGNVLIRKSYTEPEKTFGLEALEDTDLVWKLANPGSDSENVAGGAVVKRTERPLKPALAVYPTLLDLVDGVVKKRKYMPKVQYIQNGDANVSDTDLAGFPLTGTILASLIGDDTELANGFEWSNQAGALVESA